MKAIGSDHKPPPRGTMPRAHAPVAMLTRADDPKTKAAILA